MSIRLLVMFSIAMASVVIGQDANTGYVWMAWLAGLLASAMFTCGLLKNGVRRPVV